MIPSDRSVDLRYLSVDKATQRTGAQIDRTTVHQIQHQIANSMVCKINLIRNRHERTLAFTMATAAYLALSFGTKRRAAPSSNDELIHHLDARLQNPWKTAFQTLRRRSRATCRREIPKDCIRTAIIERRLFSDRGVNESPSLFRSGSAICRLSVASLASHRTLSPSQIKTDPWLIITVGLSFITLRNLETIQIV